MSIENSLKQFGLKDKEIQVYLALLKLGKGTPSSLSKLTKINRATVYNITKTLQSKELIADDVGNKSLYLIPLHPSNLKQVIARQMRELEEKGRLIDKVVGELSLITADKKYPVPKIRFVEESDLEDFLYANIEKWQGSVKASDKVWWGTQDPTFLEQYGDFVDWYWKQPFSKGVKMYQVGNESDPEREMHKKHPIPEREIHFSKDLNFTSSVWVGGEYLIMIVTNQHPFYLVEINNAVLSRNMREVFKKMWKENKTNSLENR